MVLRLSLFLAVWAAAISPAAAQPARTDSRNFLNRSAAAWVADLEKNSDVAARRTAAFALGKVGLAAAGGSVSPLQALVKALADEDEGVREAAAFALGEIGPFAAPESVPPLVRLLEKDPAAAVRRGAAFALGKIGQRSAEGPAATAALLRALADKDARVRQNAAWALGQFGPETAAQAAPGLRPLLADADPLVRRDTALALGSLGPGAREAVPDLVRALADADQTVRENAVAALGRIGPDAASALPGLLGMLGDKELDEDLLYKTLVAVNQIGGAGLGAALPAARRALGHADPAMREVGSALLVTVGAEAHPAIGEMVAALTDADPRVRRNVALALHKALPGDREAARKALPTLLDRIEEDPDDSVRQYLAWAFFKLPYRLRDEGLSRAKEVLVRVALNDKATIVRYETARAAVVHFGPEAREVIPTLIANLKDERVNIIKATSASVKTAGQEGKTGSSNTELQAEGDGRVLAAWALGLLGTSLTPEARQALEEAAKDKTSPALRDAAKQALRGL